MVCDMIKEDPLFGEIIDILQSPTEEVLFVIRMLSVIKLNTNYHAYEVSYTNCVNIIYKKSVDYHPLHVTALTSLILSVLLALTSFLAAPGSAALSCLLLNVLFSLSRSLFA